MRRDLAGGILQSRARRDERLHLRHGVVERHVAGRRAGDDDPRVREGILLAINGVAAGLRNSG